MKAVIIFTDIYQTFPLFFIDPNHSRFPLEKITGNSYDLNGLEF